MTGQTPYNDLFAQALGARIKQARLGAGLKREGLAVATSVCLGTIRRFELGESEPKAGQLVRIAEATGKSFAWFVEGETTAP